MPYESPIYKITKPLSLEIDDYILKCVWDLDIHVDKDELVRALKYDRDQYIKGLNDGRAKSQRWIPVEDALPEESMFVVVTSP